MGLGRYVVDAMVLVGRHGIDPPLPVNVTELTHLRDRN